MGDRRRPSNAGVARSSGQILCFLDADDFFYATKVEEVVSLFKDQCLNTRPIMVHHPVEIIDEITGKMTGQAFGNTHASPYNSYNFARKYHFVKYIAGPTTGISINRQLADLLFPLPDRAIRTSADDFIVKGASLIGEVYLLNKPLAAYRIHGKNAWYTSARRQTREFFKTLDSYLNEKLLANNLAPVMSLYDSMECWSELVFERRWCDLASHMVRLILAQRDLYTIKYVYETAKLIIRELKR